MRTLFLASLVLWATFFVWILSPQAAMVLSIFLVPYFAFQKLRTYDPYGTFHLAFNVPPGADPGVHPETEWLNMGYWKETKIFPQACEALALKLIHAAKSIPGGRVLDVGHACGDSLLLQIFHPDVPRPASLCGITKSASHHIRSRERIRKQQLLHPQDCEVTLFCGDAVFHPQDNDHPLDPSSSTPPFTTILALDSAYHFASRELFLQQSFARLAPGGCIALADLAVVKPLPFCLRSILSTALSVFPGNMITPQQYEAQLRMIGYVDIHITNISDDVFPEFRTFLKSRGRLWELFSLVIAWWVKVGGQFLIVVASKSERRGGTEPGFMHVGEDSEPHNHVDRLGKYSVWS